MIDKLCAQCGYSVGHSQTCPRVAGEQCRACTCPRCLDQQRVIHELVARLALEASKHSGDVAQNAVAIERLLKKMLEARR